jgi:hypothetical protein
MVNWRMSECNVLGKIFRPKREEVTRYVKTFIIEKLQNCVVQMLLYNKIWEDELGGLSSTNRRDEKCLQNIDFEEVCDSLTGFKWLRAGFT